MKLAALMLLVCAADARAGQLVTGGADVPLEHAEVAIRVAGPLVDATLTERFHNGKARVAAAYVLQLPAGATVTDVAVANGTHAIHGAIGARVNPTYTTSAVAPKLAALVTEPRADRFVQWVPGVAAGTTVDVTLHYRQQLEYRSGGYELVVPRGGDVTIDLEAGVPIADIDSPSHHIAIEPRGPTHAIVRATGGTADLVLRYTTAGKSPALGVLADGDRAIAIVQPPAAPAAIVPRELIFLLDTSPSLRGAPLASAKELIATALARLRPDDTYSIVRFADTASPLGPAPVATTPVNIDLTMHWLSALDATTPTSVAGFAAVHAIPHDPARLRIVVLLTDGHAGAVPELDGRVFAFGVGSAVDRAALEAIAIRGRGAAVIDASHGAIARLIQKIDAPLLTDLAIDGPIADVEPLPDLFAGEPLVIAGRITGGGPITLRSKQGELHARVVMTDDHPAIAARWARARIAALGDTAEARALAVAHHLPTRDTAFVADAGPLPVAVPAPLRPPPPEIPWHEHVVAVPVLYEPPPIIVAGSLTLSIVHRYIRDHTPQIRYCYDQQRIAHPGIAGTITTKFLIDAHGLVVTASAAGFDAEVAHCVANVLLRIEFPSVPGGEPVQVNFPFTFVPPHQESP